MLRRTNCFLFLVRLGSYKTSWSPSPEITMARTTTTGSPSSRHTAVVTNVDGLVDQPREAKTPAATSMQKAMTHKDVRDVSFQLKAWWTIMQIGSNINVATESTKGDPCMISVPLNFCLQLNFTTRRCNWYGCLHTLQQRPGSVPSDDLPTGLSNLCAADLRQES